MRPLVPVLIAFIAGLVFSERFQPSYPVLYVLLALSFSGILAAYLTGLKFRSVIAAPAFFLLGALFILPYSRAELPANHIINLMGGPALDTGPAGQGVFDVTGVVYSAPEFDGRRTRLAMDSTGVLHKGRWQGTEGRVRVTVEGGLNGPLRPGDRVRMLVRLREPRNFGNPGEFDFKRRLNFRGVYAIGYVKHSRFILKTREAGAGAWIHLARDRIRAFMDASGARNAGVFKALTLGEKAGVERALREAFITSGTAHILAISGLHVGVVAFAAYLAVLTLLKLSARLMLAVNVKKAAAVATVPVVLFYGAMAGFPVSTQRSVLMAVAVVFTVLIDRGREYYNILCLAALSVLIFEPYALWDVAFQLTFAAVLAILYLTPRLGALIGGLGAAGAEASSKDKTSGPCGTGNIEQLVLFLKERLPGRLAAAFCVTLAATIGTYPVLAFHFNRVSPAGVLANLVAVPAAGVVVPLLFLASTLQFLWEGAALVLLYATDALFTALVHAIRLFSELPYASVTVTTPTPLEMALFYLLVVSVAGLREVRAFRYVLLAVLVLLGVDYGYLKARPLLSKELKATFISVGQGDSALVELPGGRTMLIDGGGLYNTDFDVGERLVSPLLLHKKIRRLDYVVLSHAQRDHMAGLEHVLKNFDVGEFWWSGVGDLRRLKRVLAERGIFVRVVDATAGALDMNGVELKLLHPGTGGGAGAGKAGGPGINESSLVLRLGYGKRSFLFTGDIGREAEEEIMQRAGLAALASDVLKAPHHGSRSSSSVAFIEAVAPKVVVVSAGYANPFGFPHPESIARYEEAGSAVLRTDLSGAVEIATDGELLRSVVYGSGPIDSKRPVEYTQ